MTNRTHAENGTLLLKESFLDIVFVYSHLLLGCGSVFASKLTEA
jgi:hypothetical protein